jgi:hypothetical protein
MAGVWWTVGLCWAVRQGAQCFKTRLPPAWACSVAACASKSWACSMRLHKPLTVGRCSIVLIAHITMVVVAILPILIDHTVLCCNGNTVLCCILCCIVCCMKVSWMRLRQQQQLEVYATPFRSVDLVGPLSQGQEQTHQLKLNIDCSLLA